MWKCILHDINLHIQHTDTHTHVHMQAEEKNTNLFFDCHNFNNRPSQNIQSAQIQTILVN